MTEATHIAFADESNYNTGRFRGVGMVSFPKERQNTLLENLNCIISNSEVGEIKWKKIKSAKYRFAAIKVINLLLTEANKGHLRVDVVIWDTEDKRHKIVGRDDIANLQWMYFQLFQNVLKMRWPTNSTWKLFPDENSAINWKKLHHRLDKLAKYREAEYVDAILRRSSLFNNIENIRDLWINNVNDFGILEISEVSSMMAPIAQAADLFVGMGVFSHQQYEVYSDWKIKISPQLNMGLFDGAQKKFTHKEDEHCFTLNYLNDKCKHYRLYVALQSTKGLLTRNPSKPVNFWLYQPQGEYDKAPLRAH